jgi:hypothetical protein
MSTGAGEGSAGEGLVAEGRRSATQDLVGAGGLGRAGCRGTALFNPVSRANASLTDSFAGPWSLTGHPQLVGSRQKCNLGVSPTHCSRLNLSEQTERLDRSEPDTDIPDIPGEKRPSSDLLPKVDHHMGARIVRTFVSGHNSPVTACLANWTRSEASVLRTHSDGRVVVCPRDRERSEESIEFTMSPRRRPLAAIVVTIGRSTGEMAAARLPQLRFRPSPELVAAASSGIGTATASASPTGR